MRRVVLRKFILGLIVCCMLVPVYMVTHDAVLRKQARQEYAQLNQVGLNKAVTKLFFTSQAKQVEILSKAVYRYWDGKF